MRATAKNQTLFAVISAVIHPSDHLFTNSTEVAIVTIKQRVMGIRITFPVPTNQVSYNRYFKPSMKCLLSYLNVEENRIV